MSSTGIGLNLENEAEMKKSNNAQEVNKSKDEKKKKDLQQSSYFQCFYQADYLVFKGFCFFIYAAYGGFIPYLPLYFKQLFLGATYAGIIVGIRPLIQCIGAPFWSVIAERYHAGKVIFLGSIIAWIVKAFVLLSVRPRNQHCIETYTNTTSNVSFFYAYDLWAEEQNEVNWIVLPLNHPILIQENKVAVVHKQEIKNATGDALSSEILKNRVQRLQMDPGKGLFDETNISKTSSRRERSVERKRLKNDTKHDSLLGGAEKDTSALQDNRQRKALNLKITNIVEAYSEELKAPVKNITKIDTYQIDFMFVEFLLIVIVAEFFESPTYPLSDASILKRLGDEREYYGRVPLWGSLGWAVASAMVGLIMNYSTYELCQVVQNNYITLFYTFVGFVAGAFVNGLWFRFSYEQDKKFEDIEKVVPMLLSLRHFSFLVAILYTGFCYGILVHFVNWYIDEIGGSAAIMGTAGAAREIAALIMFAINSTTLQAVGNVNTMVFCLLLYIICFICYSVLENPWKAVALEVLDGGTYGLVWSSCVTYMSDVGSKLGIIETTQGKTQ